MQIENTQKPNCFLIIRSIELELRKRWALNSFILNFYPLIKAENTLEMKLRNWG